MNTIVTIIVSIGSLCAAILGIITFCKKIILNPLMKKIDDKIEPVDDRIKEMQKQATEKFKDIDDNQKDAQLRLLRLEILNLINNNPKNLDTILETFDEYKALGGNHYIDAIISKWKKSQGID